MHQSRVSKFPWLGPITGNGVQPHTFSSLWVPGSWVPFQARLTPCKGGSSLVLEGPHFIPRDRDRALNGPRRQQGMTWGWALSFPDPEGPILPIPTPALLEGSVQQTTLATVCLLDPCSQHRPFTS